MSPVTACITKIPPKILPVPCSTATGPSLPLHTSQICKKQVKRTMGVTLKLNLSTLFLGAAADFRTTEKGMNIRKRLYRPQKAVISRAVGLVAGGPELDVPELAAFNQSK